MSIDTIDGGIDRRTEIRFYLNRAKDILDENMKRLAEGKTGLRDYNIYGLKIELVTSDYLTGCPLHDSEVVAKVSRIVGAKLYTLGVVYYESSIIHGDNNDSYYSVMLYRLPKNADEEEQCAYDIAGNLIIRERLSDENWPTGTIPKDVLEQATDDDLDRLAKEYVK